MAEYLSYIPERHSGNKTAEKLQKLGVVSPDLSKLKAVVIRKGLVIYVKKSAKVSEVRKKFKKYAE